MAVVGVAFLLFFSVASALQCYIASGVSATCNSTDGYADLCAVVTINGQNSATCATVYTCSIYGRAKKEALIDDYSCCDTDLCNDPGISGGGGNTTGGPTFVNTTVYMCTSAANYPGFIGSAQECVSQHNGTECVYCIVTNPSGTAQIPTCVSRYNYTCDEIANSIEVDAGYCHAGFLCPASSISPSLVLVFTVAVTILLSFF